MKTFLLAFGALFSIVNPLSGAFIFFGATRGLDPKVRSAVSRWVSIYSFSIMTASLYVGAYVLSFFGISIPVLRVAGGIVVAASGWRMLNAPDATEQRRSETPEPRSIEDPPSRLAFYPLTMPRPDDRAGHDLGGNFHRREPPQWLPCLLGGVLRGDPGRRGAAVPADLRFLSQLGTAGRLDRAHWHHDRRAAVGLSALLHWHPGALERSRGAAGDAAARIRWS